LNTVDDREIDLAFAALADPTRRAILTRLTRGQATVNVLAEPFETSLQSISRHLKVLEGAGLITRGRNAQFRPCAFREEPFERAARWIEQSRETWRRGGDRPGQPKAGVDAAPAASAFATRADWAR
jgi:DNA-binding transcriptional ArsR family regulator